MNKINNHMSNLRTDVKFHQVRQAINNSNSTSYGLSVLILIFIIFIAGIIIVMIGHHDEHSDSDSGNKPTNNNETIYDLGTDITATKFPGDPIYPKTEHVLFKGDNKSVKAIIKTAGTQYQIDQNITPTVTTSAAGTGMTLDITAIGTNGAVTEFKITSFGNDRYLPGDTVNIPNPAAGVTCVLEITRIDYYVDLRGIFLNSVHIYYDIDIDEDLTPENNMHLHIYFGENKLTVGSGLHQSLTFNDTGLSTSVTFIDGKFRVVNSGAHVDHVDSDNC